MAHITLFVGFFLHIVVGSLLVGTSTDVLHHLSLRVEHPVAPGAAEDHLLLVVVSPWSPSSGTKPPWWL